MYDRNDHSYPVGLHRLRITMDVLRNARPEGGRLVDLGCGGGDLCLAFGEVGWQALGLDQSPEMIAVARSRAEALPSGHRARVSFDVASFDEVAGRIPTGSCDAVTALGFLGYLPDDDAFFVEVERILAPGGHAVVSCRNRLLNMMTGSRYMQRELRGGGALALLEEIDALYESVPQDAIDDFLQRLAAVSARASELMHQHRGRSFAAAPAGDPKFTFDIEARQHTPRQLQRVAAQHGLTLRRFIGAHPHLLPLRANHFMPPGLYNELSLALCAFEQHPLSLVWSSVCVGHFQKAA
jgi:SAM-dependent methyltransferase